MRLRYAGRSDEPLTGVGRQQIADLTADLRGHGIREIWTSGIARACESAEVIVEQLDAPVRINTRLNEIAMGPWEGLAEADVAMRYPAEFELWHTAPDLVMVEGRETLQAVAERMRGVLAEASDRPQPVLLVTHVAPIRVAVLGVLCVPLRCYKDVVVNNADCFVVDLASQEVRRLNRSESLRLELGAWR